MYFMTPRGLKIRLGIPYAFALMGRLFPRRAAYAILKTAEGLEDLPLVAAYTAGMIVLISSPSVTAYAIAFVAAAVGATLLLHAGVFVLPGLQHAASALSYIAGFGLFVGSSLITAWLRLSWGGLIVVALSWVGSIGLMHVIDFGFSWQRSRKLDYPITRSELVFFHAYRLHADEIEVTRELAVARDELDAGRWLACLQDYAVNYPESVSRFQNAYNDAIAGYGPADSGPDDRR